MPVPTKKIDTPNVLNDSFSWDGLPSDVLLEVASYLRDDRHALLSLSLICSYWRRVLVECPLNWTKLSTKQHPKMFKLWLQRSRGVPVDAEIFHFPNELYGPFIIVDRG